MQRRQPFKKFLSQPTTSPPLPQEMHASTQTTKMTHLFTCHPQRWKFVSLAAVSRLLPKLVREVAPKRMQDHRTPRLCARDRTESIRLIRRKESLPWVQVAGQYQRLQDLQTRDRQAERKVCRRNDQQAIKELAGLAQLVVCRIRGNLLWSCQTRKTHLVLHRQALLKKALSSKST